MCFSCVSYLLVILQTKKQKEEKMQKRQEETAVAFATAKISDLVRDTWAIHREAQALITTAEIASGVSVLLAEIDCFWDKNNENNLRNAVRNLAKACQTTSVLAVEHKKKIAERIERFTSAALDLTAATTALLTAT